MRQRNALRDNHRQERSSIKRESVAIIYNIVGSKIVNSRVAEN